MRKWHANSSSKGEHGISKDSLDSLRKLVADYNAKGQELYCTLSHDEMHIRRNLQWSDCQKKFIGNITYGSIPENAEYLPIANNVIVFMVNGINAKFNLPVAFEFINCLQSHEKAAMILMVLKTVTEIGVKVIGITFDGLANNITTCILLGANFDLDANFRPYIINPDTNAKVFIILDPPHMIKLLRNCIGTMKTLYHANGRQIEWKYFELLEELRTKCDLVTHKLTKEHILFLRNIMNVRLAAETLSESVAKSMERLALLSQTKDLFDGCDETVDFARRSNRLFDIFNSSAVCRDNIFKSPINSDSKEIIFSFLDETVDYFKGLKLDRNGNSILKSRRKTAFQGFIINAHNLKQIYSDFVETGKLDFLPTRSLNQDPLENLFGRIRSCLGSNDNPTTEQFCATYRKVLINTELTCSTLSNCADQLNILQVASTHRMKATAPPVVVKVDPAFFYNRKRKHTDIDADNDADTNADDNNDVYVGTISNLLNGQNVNATENGLLLFDGAEQTIVYLASLIEEKMERQVRSNCTDCVGITSQIFKNNDKYLHDSCDKPCESTVNIGRVCNNILRLHAYHIDFNYAVLLRCIEESLESYDLFPQTDFSHNLDHKRDLINFIVEEFVRIRATYIARKITLNEKKKMLRRKNLKLIHFAGE